MTRKRIPGEVEARLVKIARRTGLRVDYTPNHLLVARHPPLDYSNIHDLAHELGHWICASKKRRSEPFFGLGDPYGDTGRLSTSFSDQEDVRAHLVGAAKLLVAKAPDFVIWSYVNNHAYLPDMLDRNVRRIMSRLRMRGLITARDEKALTRIWDEKPR